MTHKDLAKALLHAETVALVGASADPAKNTGRPQRFLQVHGYEGEVVPINPNRDEVQGAPAFPKLTDVPKQIDHAFIMVPASHVPKVIIDCASAKIPVATIYTDGFAETGSDGAALQRRIVNIARDGNVRIIGPNSMGVIDTRSRLTLTINAFLEASTLQTGRLGVISQSGSVIGTMMSRGQARGISFSSLVSIGNESDVTVAELLHIMVDDPGTDAILLFLEGIRDAENLGTAARRAFDANKPVIAYKLGRSDVGKEIAISHSGAIAGPDISVDAFFRHHGILRVDMLETLFELPLLVQGTKPAKGNTVAVVTTTGGGSAMVVDRLGAAGLELASPSPLLKERMAKFGLNLGHQRIIDLTMVGTGKGIYAAALDVLMNDKNIDAVVAVVGTSAQFHPEVAVQPIIQAPRTGKPLATFLVPQADRSLALLAAAGIAAFRTPEACADGVCALLKWRQPTQLINMHGNLAPVQKLLSQNKGKPLTEQQSAAIFSAIGVPMAPTTVLETPESKIPDDLIFPVAAKVSSASLPHKTEARAVALGLTNADDLRTAARRIWASAANHVPDAHLDGILVQPMISGLAEVLIGFRRDPETGPMVILGMGGILAEIYNDAAVRPAPIEIDLAYEMISEVQGLALIRGYRNLPNGDLEALATAIAAVSRLEAIQQPLILEAEINPLIIHEARKGIVGVDALVHLQSEYDQRVTHRT